MARLGDPEPLPNPSAAPEADAAGVQFWSRRYSGPGRLSFDAAGDSPVAGLWRRLDLNDPAGAEPVLEGGRITALRLR
jgi:hypothetical protein